MTNYQKTIQYNLRITEKMRERLKQSAKDNERTMNADIVARLEASFDNVPLEETINTMSEDIKKIKSLLEDKKAP